jgi:hypothetical protein
MQLAIGMWVWIDYIRLRRFAILGGVAVVNHATPALPLKICLDGRNSNLWHFRVALWALLPNTSDKSVSCQQLGDHVAINPWEVRAGLWQPHGFGLSHYRIQRLAGQDSDGCEGVVVPVLLGNTFECWLK